MAKRRNLPVEFVKKCQEHFVTSILPTCGRRVFTTAVVVCLPVLVFHDVVLGREVLVDDERVVVGRQVVLHLEAGNLRRETLKLT